MLRGQHATGPQWPGNPDCRHAWLRCAVLHAKSYLENDRVCARWRGCPCHARARSLSLHARESSKISQSVPAQKAPNVLVPCPPNPETSADPTATKYRHRRQLPHLCAPRQSPARNGNDFHAAMQVVAQATAVFLWCIVRTRVDLPLPQSPISWCCDDRLNPP